MLSDVHVFVEQALEQRVCMRSKEGWHRDLLPENLAVKFLLRPVRYVWFGCTEIETVRVK